MITNLIAPLQSSFLSCEKDAEIILRRLFVDYPQHAKMLKRLLIINAKDCLDNLENEVYNQVINSTTVKDLVDKQYVSFSPRIRYQEHDEIKSHIIIGFDNFIPNMTNPEFRDSKITFDIFCFNDYWDLGNYRQRPLKIAGYIDGLMDKTHLSGIGECNFFGAQELVLNPDIAGYTLTYHVVRGSDDVIEPVIK